jgi:hypothetical protein
VIPDWLQAKNSRNVARWRWRWHLQSGSRFWIARDLQDLRTEEELQMWRRLEHALRHTPYSKRKVVNIARLRDERAKRKMA